MRIELSILLEKGIFSIALAQLFTLAFDLRVKMQIQNMFTAVHLQGEEYPFFHAYIGFL